MAGLPELSESSGAVSRAQRREGQQQQQQQQELRAQTARVSPLPLHLFVATEGGVRRSHEALRVRLREKRAAQARYSVDESSGTLVMPDINVFDSASQFVRERIRFMRSHESIRNHFERQCEAMEAEKQRKRAAAAVVSVASGCDGAQNRCKTAPTAPSRGNISSQRGALPHRQQGHEKGGANLAALALAAHVESGELSHSPPNCTDTAPSAAAQSRAQSGQRAVSTSAQSRRRSRSPPSQGEHGGPCCGDTLPPAFPSSQKSHFRAHGDSTCRGAAVSARCTSESVLAFRAEQLRRDFDRAQRRRCEVEERLAHAERNRHLLLTTAPRQREWLRLITLQRSIVLMRRLSDAKFYRLRQRCHLLVAACCAGHWTRLTRRTRMRRGRLKANIIFRIHMPRLLERFRARKFGRRIDVIKNFLVDLRTVFQIPHSIKRFIMLVRQSQIFVRRHLLARKMWMYAVLATWEKCVEREVTMYESAARYAATARGSARHERKLRQVVRSLEERQLMRGTDTPLLMFVPFEYRVLVVREFIVRWTHESIKKLVAEDARHRGGGTSGNFSPDGLAARGGAIRGSAAGGECDEALTVRLAALNSIRKKMRRHTGNNGAHDDIVMPPPVEGGGQGGATALTTTTRPVAPPRPSRSAADVALVIEQRGRLGSRATPVSRLGTPRSGMAATARSSFRGSPLAASPRSPPRASLRTPRTPRTPKQRPELPRASARPTPVRPSLLAATINASAPRASLFAPAAEPAAARRPSAAAGDEQKLAVARLLANGIDFSKRNYRFHLFSSPEDVGRLVKYVNDRVFSAQRMRREEIVSHLLVTTGAVGSGAGDAGGAAAAAQLLSVAGSAGSGGGGGGVADAASGSAEFLGQSADDALIPVGGQQETTSSSGAIPLLMGSSDGERRSSGSSSSGGGSAASDARVSDAKHKADSRTTAPDCNRAGALAASDYRSAEADEEGSTPCDILLTAAHNRPCAISDVAAAAVVQQRPGRRSEAGNARRINDALRTILITGMVHPACQQRSLSARLVAYLQRYSDTLARAGADVTLTMDYADFYGISDAVNGGLDSGLEAAAAGSGGSVFGGEPQGASRPLLLEMPADVAFLQYFVADSLLMKDTQRSGMYGGSFRGERAAAGAPGSGFGAFSLM